MTSDDGKKPFNNPFGALRGGDPPAPEPPAGGVSLPERKKAPEPPRAAAPAKKSPRPGGAVIRLERTGRGGKEVTVIERVGVSAADREKLLKRLKSALGCGGTIEGDSLVLQGDQRERLESPAVANLLLRGARI
jgi:translation initiation factor 1